jgi:formate hydrogenlyase subunit 4
LLLYLLGLGRFFTIAAAMDTASPFEGMGAAREAYFPIICEATLFMIDSVLYVHRGGETGRLFSGNQPFGLWHTAGVTLLFVVIAFFIVLLTENSRVPVDDPATHLELTMIHEVMVLDHSGPDFALIELGAFFKLFFYAAIIARLICPFSLGIPADAMAPLCFRPAGLHGRRGDGIGHGPVPHGQGAQVCMTSFALAFFATIITLEFIK